MDRRAHCGCACVSDVEENVEMLSLAPVVQCL